MTWKGMEIDMKKIFIGLLAVMLSALAVSAAETKEGSAPVTAAAAVTATAKTPEDNDLRSLAEAAQKNTDKTADDKTAPAVSVVPDLLAGDAAQTKKTDDAAAKSATAVSTPAVTTKTTNKLGLTVKPYDNKALISWSPASAAKIAYYTVTVDDVKGNLIRQWRGVADVTRSVLLKGLAPEFSFNVSVSAYDTAGNTVYSAVAKATTGKAEKGSELITYTVFYRTDMGSLYGFETEQVMFGEAPSKAPSVTAPEGYAFEGWSIDGKKTVVLSSQSVYADTVYYAVFKEAKK